MDHLQKFKEFTSKRSGQVYTYLNEFIPYHEIIEELLLNSFARYYRTYKYMPDTLNSDQWLTLIINQYLIEFCDWRMGPGADLVLGFTTYQASVLKEERLELFNTWVAALNEAERTAVEEYLLTDVAIKTTNNPVADLVERKFREWGKKYGKEKE